MTGNMSNFGFQPFTGQPGSDGIGFELTASGNFDIGGLKMRNVGLGTAPSDAHTKSQSDINDTINVANTNESLLTQKGSLFVFSDNGGSPIVVEFSPGTNNQLITYDNTIDDGIKVTSDVIINTLEVNSICSNTASELTLEINTTATQSGTTTTFQVGNPLPAVPTNDAELIIRGKRDVSIFLQGDDDGIIGGDSTFVSHTIKANAVFAGLSLNKTTNNFELCTAQDGTESDVDLVLRTAGTYAPTSSRPVPSGHITGLTMDGSTANVEIPTQLDTPKLIVTEIVHTLIPQIVQRQLAVDTVTLTTAQVLGGFLMGTPTADAVYTLPTSAALVGALSNPVVGQTFRFEVYNNSGPFDIDMARNGASQTILTPAGIGGVFRIIVPVATGVFYITFTNVSSTTETIDIVSAVHDGTNP